MLIDDETKGSVLTALRNCLAEPDLDSQFYISGHTIVSIAYAGTPKGSPVRDILVDFFAHNAESTWVMKEEDFPRDFFAELSLRLLLVRPLPRTHTEYKYRLTSKERAEQRRERIRMLELEKKTIEESLPSGSISPSNALYPYFGTGNS